MLWYFIQQEFIYSNFNGNIMVRKRDEEYLEEELEEDIYNEKKREEMLESDEISSEEEAFMQGYEEA